MSWPWLAAAGAVFASVEAWTVLRYRRLLRESAAQTEAERRLRWDLESRTWVERSLLRGELDRAQRQLSWQYVPCTACGGRLDVDEIVWVTRSGVASTEAGMPWCVGCAPEQNDYETAV